ncbi:preprotein translocase subunit SecA [Patescibacteria group bacterium]|nr:preprotein translocase subunit SecA [Patescibacteria group bacterium]MBU4367653.1 preprotein translocase subunit SecA [Patescibacteria group bacterium]MBU4461897.1 preprotein translocase subunit SecA [Patescibacteria group bacterium]MCG2699972.1 preprotein translocase subunit SecA [Candidatus Parcubacteria bacterium]
MSIITKIFGDTHQKYLKKLYPLVSQINLLEAGFKDKSDKDLSQATQALKEKITQGKSLDELLPEAFALVRESAKRTLKQRHFDVQLMGGITLHQGKIAEMKTGEGKTLVATLSAYLNALTGKGVHIITVNDYLAIRDTVWMGQIYNFLGLTVGCINHAQSFLYDPDYKKPDTEKDQMRDKLGGFKIIEDFLKPVSRQEAYLADITYGTNNEFGFDYLKDNMVYDLKEQVQRGHNFAIVDEIDSILIDEARTPLIISSPGGESTEKYYHFAKVISRLKEKEDYEIDEKMKAVTFTEGGQNKIVKDLGSDPWLENDIATTHQLESALKARNLFQKDRDYVVKEGEVVIVDEFTGRLMPGRRWSSGLHQAVEAKEGVKVQEESRTWATITFQNYFRMYKTLSGMTGTALTSAEEFDKVYKLDVISVPTNKPMVRKDASDKIFKSVNGKFTAVVREIKKCYQVGQPVLVGTVSIDKNEYLGKLLEKEGIPHNILNAKNHQKEAEIIAQTGKTGAITIATNMAGRGVDIVLGGNPSDPTDQKKVIEAGGLHVIGTERHEARRIDNQLRGRSGRQGDPGSSQFFVSLEDDLMRIFGGDRIKPIMETFKVPEDEPIESGMISKVIESAQAKVEGFNFDVRQHVLEYDEVMNKHRGVFYKKRKEILERAENNTLKEYVLEILKKNGVSEEDYNKKEKEVGQDVMRQIDKLVCLRALDTFWIEHLENMEYLRDSVRLRAYGQQDPLIEYKNEGRRMFQRLLSEVEAVIANSILKAEVTKQKPIQPQPIKVGDKKTVGRNDPCPCGAKHPDGRPMKYKHCHGR